jgi:hypothetical protein
VDRLTWGQGASRNETEPIRGRRLLAIESARQVASAPAIAVVV